MFNRPRRRIELRHGRYRVNLPAEERQLVRQLLGDLRALLALGPDDPRLRRLYPDAYAEDPERQADFRRMTEEDLLNGRLASVDDVEKTVDADELTADQLTAWMHSVNTLRLVLGTMLEVTEDDQPFNYDSEDPDAATMALYGYLGVLLEEIVEAQLSSL